MGSFARQHLAPFKVRPPTYMDANISHRPFALGRCRPAFAPSMLHAPADLDSTFTSSASLAKLPGNTTVLHKRQSDKIHLSIARTWSINQLIMCVGQRCRESALEGLGFRL